MNASPLQGKVVLISGASSGFGADAARLFAREGARVVLSARRLERLESLAAEIRAGGGEALVVPADVSRLSDLERLVQTTLETWGQIDILFNNAGFGRLDYLENLDFARDIETQVEVNLLGVIGLTRLVLPHMLQRRQGHIINMSSVAGWLAAPLYSVYAASKFGVRGFTDALRREVAPFGIHVSGIYPGPAATEFGLHVGQNPAKAGLKWVGRFTMTSEYVARKVVEVARRPRRTLIIPWWFRPLIALDWHFPGLVDWFIVTFFTRRTHHFEK
ncbi:MAG: SDR family NAD(P)-dependent oxidoreductase [Chloroflexi bacterium]|jgi:short-subunit dehydrogenase|nr:SDR family NAD(P)-dependent oxidoreductase [Chloroflexota bacterium]